MEGIEDQVLLECFRRAGIEPRQEEPSKEGRPITKADLVAWGLSGGAYSRQRRLMLQQSLSLPARLSANALLSVLNSLYDYDQLRSLLPLEWN